jgi:hypothetical protein
MKARLLGARYFQIVVLTVLAGILYLGAHFFVETFRINRVWMERVEIPSALAFDANTFDFLSAGGAIWPVRDGVSVSLGHAPCNTLALRSPETVTLVSGPAGEDGRKYIRELCESRTGRTDPPGGREFQPELPDRCGFGQPRGRQRPEVR